MHEGRQVSETVEGSSVHVCACVCVSDMSDEASARAAFRAALCDIPTSMSVKWESDPSSDICT